MTEILAAKQIEQHHLNAVLVLGIAIFGGTVGARLFQRLRIPQVVGYVIIGILIGPVLKVIDMETVRKLEPFNLFALGIIGFMVGGELKKDIFIKFGKQVTSILMFEGLAAFFLVAIMSFFITWYFKDWKLAAAVGVVFGAICAATDPASTVQVLWEYKTRGPLTTMLTAIVALDDALALILYAIGVSLASVFTGIGGETFTSAMSHSLLEVVFSVGMGIAAGLILTWILKLGHDHDKILAFSISSVLLSIGLAMTFHLDVILAAMALGVTMINMAPYRTKISFDLVHKFSPPIHVLFFVLVGARLNISGITPLVGLLVAAYVIGSIVGKTGGSYIGASVTRAPKTVKNYLGLCLYPQGGIAVGLLIIASHRFDEETAQIMLLVIVIGAFILQIIGPVCTKVGARLAGEIGLNVTEEDLIKTYQVADVIDTDVPQIGADTPISEILSIIASSDSNYFPVVNPDGTLAGAITMQGIRNTFNTHEVNDWLIALDIMEPIRKKTAAKTPLSKALESADEMNLDFLPVAGKDGSFFGVLDTGSVNRKLSAMLLEKQREADAMHQAV